MMRSLGARLFVAAIAFLSIALLFTWLALTQIFADYVADDLERELRAISDTITANLSTEANALALAKEPLDPRFEIAAGGRYWQINGPQDFVKRSRSLWDTEIVDKGKLTPKGALHLSDGPSGDPLLVLSQDITLDQNGKEIEARVQVAADKSEYDAALTSFRSRLRNMLLLTGLFLLTAAALQIFVGLRPLFAVRKAVSALRQGQIKQINIKGPAEVRPLILEINSLMADNSAAVERARARASDLAHGMKTPLTILAQIGEALAGQKNKQHARQIGDQVSIIASRVDRQLALARTGTAASVTGIQMNEALQKLLKAATPLAHHAGKEISYEPHDAFFIRTDMTDFLEASGNVMDNAIRHSYKTIQMSAADLGKFVRVTIEDDGPGIAEADRTRVFERGIRLDESEGGSGLGFAISADILRAYDGTVSLARSKLGGLAVHMDWPKAILRGKTDYERQK